MNSPIRSLRYTLVLWSVLSAMYSGFAADAPVTPRFGLTVDANGILTKDGKPYHGIGVNYFDVFYRTLLKPDKTSYEAGFKTLAELKIPFVRFMGAGFWPKDNALYRDNKTQYFERLDKIVRTAEKYHIGLIPSLFWNLNTVPDMVGEPCDQWGNPASKTHEFMRTYTREVVTRYRNSPAIWGWEFGNEYNLAADLPNAAEHRPAIVPDLGTPATRSARDELTHEMIRTAFAAFAREVRKYDTYRIITSGNAFPRASAWHQMHEKSWTKDTPEQYSEMLRADNPDPMRVICVHAYGEDDKIAPTMALAGAAKKPLFIGEFGVQGEPSPATEQQFAATLATIERAQVPLAALWVYDFGNQNEWSVTASNARSYQLRAIAAADARINR